MLEFATARQGCHFVVVTITILNSGQQAVRLCKSQLGGRGEKSAKQSGLGEHGENCELLSYF